MSANASKKSSSLNQALRAALAGGVLFTALPVVSFAVTTGDLLVTSGYYTGTATPIVPGITQLPGSSVAGSWVTATNNSDYPTVFQNDALDASFGITVPIYISVINSKTGQQVGNYNLTRIAASQGTSIVNSLSSKSELAIQPSTDGKSLTLIDYFTTAGQIDISNSNTPGVIDTANLTYGYSSPTYRAVAEIKSDGSLLITKTNAYSGNNGRGAILNSTNNTYYMTGNAGNAGTGQAQTIMAALSGDTGVQSIVAGSTNPATTAIGVTQGLASSSTGYQHGFAMGQINPLTGKVFGPDDKSGKDNDVRGMTAYNGTLYVSKGSSSNGINTVFQVGAGPACQGKPSVQGAAAVAPAIHGAAAVAAACAAAAGTAAASGDFGNGLLGANTAITVLPGFPTVPSKTGPITHYPFGLWFADANTLYVADEGDGTLATASTNKNAGLQKWVLESDGLWHNVYTLQNGLDMGVYYTVSGSLTDAFIGGSYSGSYYPTATAGLRNITGRLNGDGTVTLYATTSTVSMISAGKLSADVGADPNKLVAITDVIAATTPGRESFTTLKTAAFGQVLRGVTVYNGGCFGHQNTRASSNKPFCKPSNVALGQ